MMASCNTIRSHLISSRLERQLRINPGLRPFITKRCFMQKFLFVALMASTVAAQAAVPDPVTAAIAQAQVDAGTVGGAVLS
jgi:hypothetical protein